ncbi:MAG: restriction endonuclease [Muribaculum sp.]|nr:restriction endonuclease [Muribaculum sp.]
MVPKFEYFILPYLKFLSDEKPHTLKELTEYIANALNLSMEDREERTKKGSFTKLYDRTQWSGTYLRKALLTEAIGRGKYVITKRGLELLATNPTYIDRMFLYRYPEFVDFAQKKNLQEQNIGLSTIDECATTPFELMETSYNELRDELVNKLLAEIKSQTPQFFECLVIKLLVAMGYGGSFEDAANVTKYSHDEGIDGVIKEDKLGLDNIYIQAKRYDTGTVGRKELQSFVGALSGKGASKGIFITTSKFTKEAIAYKPASHIKIVLIDGDQLANYMIDYNIGVSIRQTFEIKGIDSDFFTEE